jgi:hypothetical protein
MSSSLRPFVIWHAYKRPSWGYNLGNFSFKPTRDTRGGILLLKNNNYIGLADTILRCFLITTIVMINDTGLTFTVMVVYDPTHDNLKLTFLRDLKPSKPKNDHLWLVLGDFSLIYRAQYKNNKYLHLDHMQQFRSALNFC